MKRLALALLVLASLAVPAQAGTTRATADRPGTSGVRVHLVYLVGKGNKDRHWDTDGTIARAVDQMQAWTKYETGGRRWYVDRLPNGRADVTFVRGSRSFYDCRFATVTDAHCVDEIVQRKLGGPATTPVDLVWQDLMRAGLKDDPDVRYLVVAEAPAGIICGMSYGPDENDLDPRSVGHLAVAFLGDDLCPADSPASGGEVTWEMVHELLHNDGAVPPYAPHTCPPASGHVCTAGLGNGSPITDSVDPERVDVMYPSPGATLKQSHLDLGHDDYYETPLPLRDVANSPWLTPRKD